MVREKPRNSKTHVGTVLVNTSEHDLLTVPVPPMVLLENCCCCCFFFGASPTSALTSTSAPCSKQYPAVWDSNQSAKSSELLHLLLSVYLLCWLIVLVALRQTKRERAQWSQQIDDLHLKRKKTQTHTTLFIFKLNTNTASKCTQWPFSTLHPTFSSSPPPLPHFY